MHTGKTLPELTVHLKNKWKYILQKKRVPESVWLTWEHSEEEFEELSQVPISSGDANQSLWVTLNTKALHKCRSLEKQYPWTQEKLKINIFYCSFWKMLVILIRFWGWNIHRNWGHPKNNTVNTAGSSPSACEPWASCLRLSLTNRLFLSSYIQPYTKGYPDTQFIL